MKRLARAFLLSIMMLLLISNVAYAAWEYYFPTHVRDTSAAGRTYYPVLLGYGGQVLVDSGKIAASGLDTNMQVGTTSIKYMMSTTNVTAVLPNLPASSTVTANLYTGYTPNQTGFPIIVGDDGSILTSDAAALEPGDTFEFEWDGYVDTSAAANKNLVNKRYATRTYVNGATNITADIYGLGGTTYPSVAAVSGGNDTVDQQNHTVNLPANIAQGDLLIVFFSTDGNPAVTFPAGWTVLFDTAYTTEARFVAYYRAATGSEGATITVTTATDQMTAHTSYRIIDYYGVPEAGVSVTSITTTPDPPNLTPSWGNQYTLWLAATAYDNGSGNTVDAYPANYTSGRNDRSNHVEGVGVGTARRNLAAISENPGTFTITISEQTISQTVAIAPIQAVTSVTATGVASGEHVVTVTEGNVVTNPGFENGDPPTGWSLAGAGATFVRSATQVHGDSWSGRLIRNGANCQIIQNVANPTLYQSNTITFSMWVYATVANRARISIYDNIGGNNSAYHTGVAGWENLSVTRTVNPAAVALQVYGWVTGGDTTAYFDDARLNGLSISIDSVIQDRAGGSAVTGNANDWYWMTENSIPYADYITYDVSGAEVIRYAPTSMLTATTLLDLTGAAQNGTITWGSNTSVTISYGAMETYESTYASSALIGGFEVPEVGLPDTWFASGANIPNLMFYDTFKMVSDESGMPVQTMYFAIVVGLALTAFLLIATYTRSALAGSLSMLIVLFIGSSQTIVPMWIPFALLIIQVAIMYLYRQVAY